MERISKKFQLFYDWMLEDKDTRISRNDFIQANHISILQMSAYEEAYQKPPDVDLEEQTKIMDGELFSEARKPSASAQMKQLWYTRHGLLIQKTENKNLNVDLTGDDHRSIREEGQRRLQAEVGGRTGGNGGVFGGIQGVHLLPEKVCVDNQSEHSEEG